MCGFPLSHLNKYLKILVQHQHRFVAMCEEFPRSPALGAKGGFDRRVVRIVTPGTLIDEPFLNPYENNYLLAVTSASATIVDSRSAENSITRVGLAWIDVSTGEFYTKVCPAEGLRDELVRIAPKEVVLDALLLSQDDHGIRKATTEEGCFISYFTPSSASTLPIPTVSGAEESSADELSTQLDPQLPLPAPLTEEEIRATELLTAFMNANLIEHMPGLAAPNRETMQERMQIDAHTVKALEIREGIREGGVTGSLLSVIKRTVTSGGTRLLARWLCNAFGSSHCGFA